MVIREENVSSNDNAKIFGQGSLSHNLYGKQKKQIQFCMYKIRKNSGFLANSVRHFAALKAKIFVPGCNGNHACWEKNEVKYFDNVTTITYSECFMKI